MANMTITDKRPPSKKATLFCELEVGEVFESHGYQYIKVHFDDIRANAIALSGGGWQVFRTGDFVKRLNVELVIHG